MGVPITWGRAAATDGPSARLRWRLAAGRQRTEAMPRTAPTLCRRLAARFSGPEPARMAANIASGAVLVAETIGSLLMWSAIPLAWIWIAGRAYEASSSLMVGGASALLGLAVTEALVAKGLSRIDGVWIALRRAAGHEQRNGALTRVVVVSATFGLIAFLVWYYILSGAFVIRFMPSQ